jgi:hypothetical protein
MTTPANPNEVPTFELSREELDAVFARTTADLIKERAARQRAADWPLHVNEALIALTRKVVSQDERIAGLEAQLAKLEVR